MAAATWPRRGATELIEGGPEPKRIVILECADTAAFKRWYNSPEYQKILPGRLNIATGRAFVVEGASSFKKGAPALVSEAGAPKRSGKFWAINASDAPLTAALHWEVARHDRSASAKASRRGTAA